VLTLLGDFCCISSVPGVDVGSLSGSLDQDSKPPSRRLVPLVTPMLLSDTSLCNLETDIYNFSLECALGHSFEFDFFASKSFLSNHYLKYY